MARPLRIEYKGVFYHTTSRRNERRRICFAKLDYDRFKEKGRRYHCQFVLIQGLTPFFLLDDRQRLALVYLRHRRQITNSDYRRLNRVDTMVAGHELRGLVQAGLIEQKGTNRWTYYTLKVAEELPKKEIAITDEEKIIAYVQKEGSINNTECRELLGVDDIRAYYLFKKLCRKGQLKPKKKGKWRRYVVA